jgi:uncharacterized protein YkwD
MWKLAVKYQVGTSESSGQTPTSATGPDLSRPGVTIPQLDSTVSSFEAEVVRLVTRSAGRTGCPPHRQLGLSRVARYKSQDMLDNRYFSHNSPTYGTPFQ